MSNPLAAFASTVGDAVRVEEAVERMASGAGLEVDVVRAELAGRAVLSSRDLNHVIAVLMIDIAEGDWPVEDGDG